MEPYSLLMSFLWQEFWMHIWPSQLNNDTTASPNVTDHPIHLFMPEKTSSYFLIICAGCILGCIFLIRFIATGVSNNQRARVTNTDWNKFMAQRHCFQSSGFFLFPALFLILIEIKKKSSEIALYFRPSAQINGMYIAYEVLHTLFVHCLTVLNQSGF